MVDPNLLVRHYLLQNSTLLAMLGPYQVTAHLPEKFDPLNGPIVVVGTEGGSSHPEIPIQTQRVKVRVWAGVDGYAVARQVYGVVHDWLHGQNDLDFGDLGTILASIEVVTGQDITDPDSGWATVLAYYDVTVREGAFVDLSGTFQQGSQTKAYIDAGDATTLATAEAYTDAHSGGNDRPYIDARDAATLATAEAYADSVSGAAVNAPHTWTKPQTFQPDTDVPGAIFKQSNVATPAADIAQFQDKTGAVQSRIKSDGSFQAGSNPATINVGSTGAPVGLGNPGSIYTREDGGDGTTLYVSEGTTWVPITHNLASLEDVTVGALADADVLRFELSSGKWKNAVAAKVKTFIASKWLDSYDPTTGLFTASQPAFSDISGVAVAGQLPNLPESQITNLTSDLALKAPLASPALTGTPTAPNAAALDDSTQLATTDYVRTALKSSASYVFLPWLVPMAQNIVVKIVNVANEVYATEFSVPYDFVLTKLSIKFNTNAVGTAGLAIYDASKNRLAYATFDSNSGNFQFVSLTGGPITLRAGVKYYFAQTCTTAAAFAYCWNFASVGALTGWLNDGVTVRFGLAGNASASGVPPTALGTFTASSNVLIAFSMGL